MPTLYHVVSQHEETELTPSGTFQKVMVVTAQSDVTQTVVSVRVPEAAYSAENVARLLDAKIDAVHAVHAIGVES